MRDLKVQVGSVRGGTEGNRKLLTLSLKALNPSKRTLEKKKKVIEIPNVLVT